MSILVLKINKGNNAFPLRIYALHINSEDIVFVDEKTYHN